MDWVLGSMILGGTGEQADKGVSSFQPDLYDAPQGWGGGGGGGARGGTDVMKHWENITWGLYQRPVVTGKVMLTTLKTNDML